jgi:hypothetical protein
MSIIIKGMSAYEKESLEIDLSNMDNGAGEEAFVDVLPFDNRVMHNIRDVYKLDKIRCAIEALDSAISKRNWIYTDEKADGKSGVKYDNGKRQYASLLPWDSLDHAMDILEFGVEKYGPNTWRSVKDGKKRYTEAAMRHLIKYVRDNDSVDEETKQNHVYHALTCLLFVAADTWPAYEHIADKMIELGKDLNAALAGRRTSEAADGLINPACVAHRPIEYTDQYDHFKEKEVLKPIPDLSVTPHNRNAPTSPYCGCIGSDDMPSGFK